MIKYGNKMIADAGCYISSNDRVWYCLPYLEDATYEEKKIDDSVYKIAGDIYGFGQHFHLQINPLINTKQLLVNSIYSNDDQIAIILNKSNSAKDKEVFNNMQGWRTYFSKKISEVKALMNEEDRQT